MKLSKKEQDRRGRVQREKIASGEVVPKVRKKRSDAGKERGPRKQTGGKRKRRDNNGDSGSDDEEKENTLAKRARKGSATKKSVASQLPPTFKSKAFVDDSDG
ncbi:hypothetical protein C0991_010801, partial [Blastosporella zonata]